MTSDAVILVAGRGLRLSPLTDRAPKALLEVAGEAILGRLLRQCSSRGILRFHLVTGYREGDIRDHVRARFPRLNVRFAFNPDYDNANNAVSLSAALADLVGPFWLLDGDLVLSEELADEMCFGKDVPSSEESVRRSGNTLVPRPSSLYPGSALICDTDVSRLDAEAMKVTLDPLGRVADIGKDIPFSRSAGEAIGIAHFDATWASALREALRGLAAAPEKIHWYYEDVVSELLSRKDMPALGILSTKGRPWTEVDDERDLKAARAVFSPA